jgi:hypothetical protein
MNDSVSRWVDAVVLTASVSAAIGILFATFPWSGLLWTVLVASTAFQMLRRSERRSVAPVVWEASAVPTRELRSLSHVAIPVPSRRASR